MLAKDEELSKVKEKHLYAEQQLRDMEEKQQQVNFEKSVSDFCSVRKLAPCPSYHLQRLIIVKVPGFNVKQVLFIFHLS